MDYRLKISFDCKVNHHYFSLKCLPKTEPRQMVNNVRISLNADYFSISRDSFGNRFWYGYKAQEHTSLNLHITAQAQVDWQKYDFDNHLNDVFLLPTQQTAVGKNLLPFYEKCRRGCEALYSDYEKALYVMQSVHDAMNYVSGATDIKTVADDAFALRQGVCQDYAQIMAAITRKLKIPSRYVAGIMMNESTTHAWVEIFANNRWYGFDPTNNLLVNDTYLVFSRGRDYKDCLVNRGIFFSPFFARQSQTIFLNVEEV